MHAEPAMFLTPETIERLHLIQSGLDAFEAAVPKTYISVSPSVVQNMHINRPSISLARIPWSPMISFEGSSLLLDTVRS